MVFKPKRIAGSVLLITLFVCLRAKVQQHLPLTSKWGIIMIFSESINVNYFMFLIMFSIRFATFLQNSVFPVPHPHL